MSLRRLLAALAILLLSLATVPAQAVQTCPAGNDRITPNSDFVDNGDATVTHSKTGLMWKQCTEGLGGVGCATGTASPMSWLQALGAATLVNVDNFAGHDNWRLPNKNELQSLVESGCYGPSINATLFPNTLANYWTSTSDAYQPDAAWSVGFGEGYSNAIYKGALSPFYVRLVRGGQSFGAFDSQASGCTLDVDGNGVQDALTDGLLIMRALLGLTGTAVTNGAIGAASMRPDWLHIAQYLNGKCGASFKSGSPSVQLPGGLFVVPGTSPTGASFTYTGTMTHLHTITFVQSNHPCLQSPTTYCTNGAGVVTVAGSVPVGGSSTFSGPSFVIPAGTWTNGALLMTIYGVGTVQVFPTNAANGLGNPTPPGVLTLPETTLSALGFPPFSQVNPTITFIVADTTHSDNGGQFLLNQSPP
ncbi:MAG: DUF1566 domain-containing protein [Casimicrobiaceae bacterium]